MGIVVANLGSAVEKQVGPFVDLPKIDAPYTTVVKRAQVTDFSKDLMPRMGVERIMLQSVQELQSEVGPTGQRVFKAINDIHEQIRFIGNISIFADSYGPRIILNDNEDFVEVVFYGTGLNVVGLTTNNARDLRVTIDNLAEGSNIWVTTPDVLSARNYATNQVINAATGLSLGLHSAKLRKVSGASLSIYGFEVLNESATIKTAPGSAYKGSKKLTLSALDSQAYNSAFETVYGTAGTKGGHVVVYQKSDGTIAKAIRYTEASISTNTSTDHTNEELIRRYKYREFGAGRSDDYSALTPGIGSSRAFTLDDGSTTLTSVAVVADLTTLDNLDHGTSSTFTFVGTGIDFLGSTGTDTRFSIDGGAEVVLPSGVTFKTLKIASGLPYGTHTVHLTRPGSGLRIVSFDVYGPKKPAIPAGAVELADYYLMADSAFVAASNSQYVSSNGTLTKSPTREFVYTGTWGALTLETGNYYGFYSLCTTNTSTVSLEFVGTGVILSGSYGTAATVTVQIDGSNYTGAATVGTGVLSGTWTPGTSTWVLTGGNGSKLAITGLAYGRHKAQITVVSQTGGYYHRGWEIITPIHSPKSNRPGRLQSTLTVGSNSIGDSRIFAETQDSDTPSWAQAVGVVSSPSTTSGVGVPMPDMSVVVKTDGGPLAIDFSGVITLSGAATIGGALEIYVDGVSINKIREFTSALANQRQTVKISAIHPVSPGVHLVQIIWASDGVQTLIATGDRRSLSVVEL